MNILAIGAHFDDIELGCSGTLVKHVEAGHRVFLIVASNSEYANPSGGLVRDAETALREGEKAAHIIGAELILLDHKTLHIPFNEDLTGTIMFYVEKYNIDTIYTHWLHDIHRDHKNVAQASMMAGRHVPRFLMYRSNFYNAGHPFNGVYYSDISLYIEKKIEVIKVHKSELERVRYKWLEFILKQNANDGQTIGVEYAECFEMIRYLA